MRSVVDRNEEGLLKSKPSRIVSSVKQRVMYSHHYAFDVLVYSGLAELCVCVCVCVCVVSVCVLDCLCNSSQ